jgi:hypothetical protein
MVGVAKDRHRAFDEVNELAVWERQNNQKEQPDER